MAQLIFTLLSIALTGIVLLSSVNSINTDAQIAAQLKPQIVNSFHTLESGYNDYVLDKGTQPSQLSDIVPHYAFLPPSINGTAWSFGSGGTNNAGRYFCLNGTFTSAMLRAAKSSQQNLSPQAYFINSTCGVTATSIPTGTNPTVALTYWVAAYQ